MKKYLSIIISLLLLIALSGCESSSGVTEEDAVLAFQVAMTSYTAVYASLLFNIPVTGATLNDETGVITLTNYDVSTISSQLNADYTTMSGTIEVTTVSLTTSLDFDLTFTGGIVQTLAVSIGNTASSASITLTANDKDFVYDYTP